MTQQVSAGSISDREVGRFADRFNAIAANVEQVIQGKTDVIRLALTCLFAEGHLLIEDVPGVGKTSLAKALSASISGSWKRIQFTPDLLPSDVTGVSIYNEATKDFEFHPGPVFANLVLGDEINRASPKTQSALLEVMQEHQVTVEGEARPVPRPFMVIATQNPVEYEGTYRLPEAQRDRFLMRARIGYPDIAAEISIMNNEGSGPSVDRLGAVTEASEVHELIRIAQQVLVAPDLQHYMARLSAETRGLPELLLGVSPRGTLALAAAARAFAASHGRGYVVPEDVKALAHPVLAHRMILTPEAEIRGESTDELLSRVLSRLDVPQGAPVKKDAAPAPAPIPAARPPAPPPAPAPAPAPAAPPAPAPAAAPAAPPQSPPKGDQLPQVTIQHTTGPDTGKGKKQKGQNF